MPRRIFRSRANQLAQDPESLVMTARSGSRGDSSQATRCGLTGLAGCFARSSSVFHHSLTSSSMVLRHLPVCFWSKPRQQRPQSFRGVADEGDLHRVADRQHAGINVDLHATRLAFLRQKFGIGESGADHQQRVAFGHQPVAWLGAQQPDRAGHPREFVRQNRLAEQRLGASGGQPVGDGNDLVGRRHGAGTDQHRNLLAGVENLRSLIRSAS